MSVFRTSCVSIWLDAVPPTSDEVAVAPQVPDSALVAWALQIELDNGVLLEVLNRY